jgi:putative ABC transport system ATP-binding protein
MNRTKIGLSIGPVLNSNGFTYSDHPVNKPAATNPSIQVQARDLRKSVRGPGGDLTILERLDLTVNAGEAVAILGASGSGKSTLLGLLAGLDQATHGEVYLFGQNLSGLDEDARARLRAGEVGFVFQNFQLLPTLTAVENILLPLELIGSPDPRAQAHQALEQVGLTQRAEHYPRQLSGGEQQRIAIARAIAAGPRILFADEPTGNLDQHTGAQIIELLLSLRQRIGVALVLVTHDAALAARCDRRLQLDQGRLEPLK